MSGDKDRDAISCQMVDQLPETAAVEGINPGGGLIKKNDRWLMQQGAAQSQPLPPTGGEFTGLGIATLSQSGHLNHPVSPLCQLLCRQPVDAAVKGDILCYGQVFIEGKFLAHVADIFLDQLGLGGNIKASHLAVTTAWFQNAAQHPDGSGFSSAVGTKETEYFPFWHRQADLVDGNKIAKATGHPCKGDGSNSGSQIRCRPALHRRIRPFSHDGDEDIFKGRICNNRICQRLQVPGGVTGQQPAMVQQPNPVTALSLIQVGSGHHNGDPFSQQGIKNTPEITAGDRVNTVGRFIKE